MYEQQILLSKQAGHDVFNALDLMQNKKFLEELKFGKGDGNLQYYLHNWKCNPFTPEQVEDIETRQYSDQNFLSSRLVLSYNKRIFIIFVILSFGQEKSLFTIKTTFHLL